MSLNKEKLHAEVTGLLEPYREVIEGAEADVLRFFERAAMAMTNAIAVGDPATAEEIAGGIGALAWSTGVQVKRAHADALRRGILFAVRTAIAALAAV